MHGFAGNSFPSLRTCGLDRALIAFTETDVDRRVHPVFIGDRSGETARALEIEDFAVPLPFKANCARLVGAFFRRGPRALQAQFVDTMKLDIRHGPSPSIVDLLPPDSSPPPAPAFDLRATSARTRKGLTATVRPAIPNGFTSIL